jgi:hypothetical protein
MKRYLSILLLVALFTGSHTSLLKAQSGATYYRSAVMDGNRVKTVFGNWGVIGQPVDNRPRGAWIYTANGYLGDVSLFVGAEVNDAKSSNPIFHSVATCPVARPALAPDQDPITGDPWTFMPVNGYFNPNDTKQSVAMSTDKTTWPSVWPDKLSDATDPGWPNSWNGYFGKRKSADLETYFVMDDNNDKRFNFANNNGAKHAFKPDANDSSRNGLGLNVTVRGMQWGDFLAQDNIFWLYEITNTGTTTYDRAVFGMIVGTLVGVTGNNSFGEYDDDWSFYDAKENITYTGDYTRETTRDPFWVNPYNVGMVGYAFLESPGNPFDGIDNDGDVDKFVKSSPYPLFTSTDFDSVLISAGNRVILVDNNFNRTQFTVPAVDSLKVWSRGMQDSITIRPGKTKLSEGGLYTDPQGARRINPNAYDGIDNDLDGIIDENYQVHFRQIKYPKDDPTKPPLIDISRPVRHYNYLTSTTPDPYSMIDERRDDLLDNNRNWDIKFDDLGRDGIAETHDAGEGDAVPTSGYLVGGTDTGLPGEAHIDKTDVEESDQIGLTSFFYFTPAGQVPLANKEELWRELSPGFFDVPTSIQNNKPVNGEDGDFIYGSGYFPLVAKKTERFSLALVYGGGNGGSRDDDINDLLKHKIIVQKIYDANYQFPTPPDPAPTLSAVAGDRSVHLYWDRKSEDFIDPVLREKTFEGYKIFKATDTDFNDAFDVTNALGVKKGYAAAFQVDIVDSTSGFFRAPQDIFQSAEGFTYYLGNNTGLVHDTTDYDVTNGRTYYYVIIAYTKGNDSTGIFPAQNKWKIDFDQFGRIRSTSQNVVIVVPGTKIPGYHPGVGKETIQPMTTVATGTISYNVVDPSKLTGHTYLVTFNDTRDSGKFVATTTFYTVFDSNYFSDMILPNRVDTIPINLPRQNIEPSTFVVRTSGGTVVPATKYILQATRGTLRAAHPGDLRSDPSVETQYRITYQYYPVYRSAYINGSKYAKETKDTDIFDGVQLVFNNDWVIQLIDSMSGFNSGSRAYSYTFSVQDVPSVGLYGAKYPSDYDIVFYDSKVDTSYDFGGNALAIPVNFRIWNRTEKKYSVFVLDDFVPGDSLLSSKDQLYIFDRDQKDSLRYTWYMYFFSANDTLYKFHNGDTLKIRVSKSFRNGDVYEFTTKIPKIATALGDTVLNQIRVVPNPYVVQSKLEAPVTPGVFGRGERKINFINVPMGAKISIFTARGDHIRTMYHDGSTSGTVSWDVKTKENLDVAYGVYFYVVESSAGQRTGKIAVIK